MSGILRSPSVILRIVGARAGSYSLRERHCPTGVTGWLTVQGDTISGQIGGMNRADVTLRKVK